MFKKIKYFVCRRIIYPINLQLMIKNIEKILKEPVIEREFYGEQIKKWIWSPLIKVIVGQRRVWKSFLLKQTIQYLVKSKSFLPESFFYLNCEDPQYDSIKEYSDLNIILLPFIEQQEGKAFIGIDEIQRIKNWEKTINGIQTLYPQCEIFITGSNSDLLSWELATYLSWRFIEIPVFPLSYEEFLKFRKVQASPEIFNEFLTYGWLPGIFSLTYEENTIFDYGKSVYNTVVLKDIFSRWKINNVYFFEILYKYIFASIGNIFTAKNITDYLKSQNIQISLDSVLNYLHYGEQAYLLFKVKTQDLSSKKQFSIYNKYYVWDIWMRNAQVWYFPQRDIGWILENYVFLLLKKHGYNIHIWRFQNNKEVDFIAEKYGKIKYFQVATLIMEDTTREREYSALEQIHDSWEKYVVSMDQFDFWVSETGIQHIHIQDLEKYL